jgi:hypothetical protein
MFPRTKEYESARQVFCCLSHIPNPFALYIFLIGSHIYVQACLDCESPIYAYHKAGITGVHYHTQLLLVEWGSQ